MSRENVEVVRRAYSVMKGTRLYTSLSAGQTHYDEYFHPDAEIVPPAMYPDIEVSYTGAEGFDRLARQWEEAFDGFRFEAERFFDAGDQVLVFARTFGTGKQSGAAVEIPTAHLYTLRDGRATRLKIFLDRTQALKAAGLEE
jgi:ketosteroid isomerase-like protein